jgi:hypothetical protein
MGNNFQLAGAAFPGPDGKGKEFHFLKTLFPKGAEHYIFCLLTIGRTSEPMPGFAAKAAEPFVTIGGLQHLPAYPGKHRIWKVLGGNRAGHQAGVHKENAAILHIDKNAQGGGYSSGMEKKSEKFHEFFFGK